jgi:hypothetical protein
MVAYGPGKTLPIQAAGGTIDLMWLNWAWFSGFLITYIALSQIDGHGQLALLYIMPFILGNEPSSIEIVSWMRSTQMMTSIIKFLFWALWLHYVVRPLGVHADLMEFCRNCNRAPPCSATTQDWWSRRTHTELIHLENKKTHVSVNKVSINQSSGLNDQFWGNTKKL